MLQKTVKTGDVCSFVAKNSLLRCRFADAVNPYLTSSNLTFDSCIIDIEDYFHGSLFDLWLYQHVTNRTLQSYMNMAAAFDTNYWYYQAFIDIRIPVGKKVEIRVYTSDDYVGYKNLLVTFFEIDDEENWNVDFSPIDKFTMNVGEKKQVDIKRGFAYVVSTRNNVSQIVQDYNLAGYMYMLQHRDVMLDSWQDAKKRRYFPMWSWLQSHSKECAFDYLAGGRCLLECYLNSGNAVSMNVFVQNV